MARLLSKMNVSERREHLVDRWLKDSVDTKYKDLQAEGDYLRSEESFPSAWVSRAGKFVVVCNSYQKMSAQKHENLVNAIMTISEVLGYQVFKVAMIEDNTDNILRNILSEQVSGYLSVSRMRTSSFDSVWSTAQEVCRICYGLTGKPSDWVRALNHPSEYISETLKGFNPIKRAKDTIGTLVRAGYKDEALDIMKEYKDKSISLKSLMMKHKKERKAISEKFNINKVTDQEICDYMNKRLIEDRPRFTPQNFRTEGRNPEWIIHRTTSSIISIRKREKKEAYLKADKAMSLSVLLYATLVGYSQEDDIYASKLGEVASVLYKMTGGTGNTKKFSSTGFGVFDLLQGDVMEAAVYLGHKSKVLSGVAATALS